MHRVRRIAPSRQWSAGMVRILERDPDLARALDPESADAARAQVVAPGLALGTGRWVPPEAVRRHRVLGLLVLDGLIVRRVDVGGVSCRELIGQGDLLRPSDDGTDPGAGGAETVTWAVLEPATLAVLDARFVEAVRRWPWLLSGLLERGAQRARSTSLQLALPQVRRADARLRLLFGHLADRWGRVTPAGTVLPLPLSNQLIGELACLRRPTVSSTMGRLAQEGEIVRRAQGGGFLLNPPQTALAPDALAA